LPRIVDERDGVLCILETQKHVPFDIKRVYYINHLEHCVSERGKHAHRELCQVIFCISGSFTLTLDDGTNKQNILMWRDNLGVILGPKLWHTMSNFSNGCVLLVVASDTYKESDYIRNYDEFIKYIRNEND
jgi:hypothetical protein